MAKDTPEAEAPVDCAEALMDHDTLTMKKCKRFMDDATQEYRYLRDDESGPGRTRRWELARALTSGSRYLGKNEPMVDIDVPLSSTREPFRINETIYYKGTHRVPASVAQILLNMIQTNRTNEANLLKQNNRDFDLGDIGQKARHAEMQR